VGVNSFLPNIFGQISNPQLSNTNVGPTLLTCLTIVRHNHGNLTVVFLVCVEVLIRLCAVLAGA
jgi:hypothetical protein